MPIPFVKREILCTFSIFFIANVLSIEKLQNYKKIECHLIKQDREPLIGAQRGKF